MEYLTVGEVARRVGVRTSALRYYESVGLIAPPKRVSGQRRYDESVLKTLALIQTAQQAGFTIAEIHMIFRDFAADAPPRDRWQELTQQKIEEMDTLIARAKRMKSLLKWMQQCQCANLDECATRMESQK
jgi:MerR family transcriptional regulator, redox-sensitive transcriptional activator SoxR